MHELQQELQRGSKLGIKVVACTAHAWDDTLQLTKRYKLKQTFRDALVRTKFTLTLNLIYILFFTYEKSNFKLKFLMTYALIHSNDLII